MFGNPVQQAYINPPGSPFVLGQFRVVSTFQDHLNRVPPVGGGTDIGNGKCNDPLLAMTTGVVTFAGTLPDGSKCVRIRSDDFPDYEVAVAHNATITVSKGQHVVRGQKIGTLGTTGASACHVHVGCKKNGVEIDIWPLLDQNQESDMLQGTFIEGISNRKTSTVGVNTRFRSSPFIKADNVLAEFGANAEFRPDFKVSGGLVGTNNSWYAGFMLTPKGREFGYFHGSVLHPLTAIEQSGYTQAQLDAAKATARAQGISAAATAAAAAK